MSLRKLGTDTNSLALVVYSQFPWGKRHALFLKSARFTLTDYNLQKAEGGVGYRIFLSGADAFVRRPTRRPRSACFQAQVPTPRDSGYSGLWMRCGGGAVTRRLDGASLSAVAPGSIGAPVSRQRPSIFQGLPPNRNLSPRLKSSGLLLAWRSPSSTRVSSTRPE